MRAGLNAILLLPALILATAPAQARHNPGRPHHRAGSDTGRTLARMAARDRHRDWQGSQEQAWQEQAWQEQAWQEQAWQEQAWQEQAWQEPRPFALSFAPATRERVAAPPFTGWGYGGTIPGAWPGF